MSKKLLDEAMADAKLLKETAIENARNVLVEAISPKIREFIETQIGEADLKDEPEMKEAKLSEEPEMAHEMYEADEKDDEKVKEEAKEEPKEMDEVVEITNEDLKKAFSEVLKSELSEATVSKSFGDAEDPNKPVDDVGLKGGKGKEETGLADKKSGEQQWIDATAPHAEDWTVKESFYKTQLKSLSGKLSGLQKENQEYKKALAFLQRNLQEVNLFNGKLLYTNKLLHNTKLTDKQRIGVIEAFDRAGSLREVELVYKSLSESLKIAGVMSEGKTLKGPKASRPVSQSGTSELLKEGVEKENGGNPLVSRFQELAGLVK